MVIRFDIQGMAFANGPGIVTCFPFPVNSHSHSQPSQFLGGGGGSIHTHLWEMDMGMIIKTEYIAKDGLPFKDKPAVDGTNVGYLLKMATTSRGLIGSLLVSSFCEHINSQATQVYSCVRCSMIVTVSVCLRVSNIHIMITCVLIFYCVFHGYCAPLTGREGWKCFVE